MRSSRVEWNQFAPALFVALALGGCMTQGEKSSSRESQAASTPAAARPEATSSASVRYQVTDVGRSLDFYTRHLGFEVEQRAGSAFASVTRGGLRLYLSGPGSSGSRPLPDGRRQEPGGWNRIVINIDHLDSHIQELRGAGVRFRNEVEVGPGGRQIQIEDPDGNPIELHEPPSRST